MGPDGYNEKAKKKAFGENTADVFNHLYAKLDSIQDWQADLLAAAVKETAADKDVGMGKVGMPLRVALTGNSSSPDIGITLELIGKSAVLQRLQQVQNIL